MERLLDIKMPAEVQAIAKGALRDAFSAGFAAGLTWGVLGCLLLAVVVLWLRDRR